MKKLIIICLLFSILNPIFAQKEVEDPYLQLYENVYIGLGRQNFNYGDFTDSVKMFIFADGQIKYNNEGLNEVIIADLNTVLVYLSYDKFSITKAKSEEDKGFIIHFYDRERVYVMYMLVDDKLNKVGTILIKK